MPIGFFLMTEKGLHVLQAVVSTFGPDQIEYVVGAADKNLAKDYRDEIAVVCRQNGIAYFDRHDSDDSQNQFRATAEYHFAVSWRWLIHDAKRLIVLHDSLPKYRGFTPLPTALINGEPFVGVTALFAGREYDRGDILGQRKLPISYPVKIQSVISSLSGIRNPRRGPLPAHSRRRHPDRHSTKRRGSHLFPVARRRRLSHTLVR
ncbi:MAG: hypothetical protein LAP61_19955 [Acidobacteriia bacterium]|nr:hypothetical protein [Terriglobia bacterium]